MLITNFLLIIIFSILLFTTLCMVFYRLVDFFRDFPGLANGRELACQFRRQEETPVWCLGQNDPLEEGMATHSRILAWRIPWTEEPGSLCSMGSQRVRHYWSDSAQAQHSGETSAAVFLFTLLHNVTFFSQRLYHLKFSSSAFIFNYKFNVFLMYIELLSQIYLLYFCNSQVYQYWY